MEFETDLDRLAQKIESAADLLTSIGESHWSKWLRGDAAMLRAGNFSAVEHFLGAFGGMGSLNDFYACRENGYPVDGVAAKDFNKKFSDMISEALTMASLIKRRVR
jgi:hypothetical protein